LKKSRVEELATVNQELRNFEPFIAFPTRNPSYRRQEFHELLQSRADESSSMETMYRRLWEIFLLQRYGSLEANLIATSMISSVCSPHNGRSLPHESCGSSH
jgi:hypothetical protein